MPLTAEERERYGRVLCEGAEPTFTCSWNGIDESGRWYYGERAAAVVAARDADLAAQVRAWRDQALDFASKRAVMGYDQQRALGRIGAYDRVLALLAGGDDGTEDASNEATGERSEQDHRGGSAMSPKDTKHTKHTSTKKETTTTPTTTAPHHRPGGEPDHTQEATNARQVQDEWAQKAESARKLAEQAGEQADAGSDDDLLGPIGGGISEGVQFRGVPEPDVPGMEKPLPH